MPSPSPRVTIARPSRSNGVLSIPASATQRKTGPPQESQSSRSIAARLKIIIRRLPPGLTQTEFGEALGNDWRVGGDKVDWATYKAGKVSKDPAKPSRPSRAYLHLTKQEHVALLADNVRNTSFADAKGSSKDSALLGPPSVEFAPYGRVPSGRPRKDARQGTIDQDPEFIDFLESLTNPILKATPMDQEDDVAGKSKDKVTVTPLVQFLKDKKANKGKENIASQKGAKHARQDSEDVQSPSIAGNKSVPSTVTVSSPKKRSAQAVRVEQAARDAVKVLNKQATNMNKGPTPTPLSTSNVTAKSPIVSPSNTANAALADKKRERGSASAAAKILQRDLGLAGNVAGRGGRRGVSGNAVRTMAATASSTMKQGTGVSQAANSLMTASGSTPTIPMTDTAIAETVAAANSTAVQPPSGPAASSQVTKPPNQPSGNALPSNPTSSSPKSAPPPSTATQAFLKHANPSQGITEPLLEEAFATFGTISKVEIDKKKGFAYVDFAESESLQKAIKASPIKVGQGQVVVLERKSGTNLQARNMRGGGPMMGHRGGGMPIGGRGGSMRGRGGFGRGGMNMPNTNNTRPLPAAATAASKQAPAAGRATTAIPPKAEASATPAASVPQPPAD